MQQVDGHDDVHVVLDVLGDISQQAPDMETIVDYMVSAPGFETVIDDGRIWVFRPGSKALKQFRKMGEPAKHVIRPAAGPMRMTVKAPDTPTMAAYLSAVK